MIINLDKAATTRPNSKVLESIMPYFTDKYYNPSSNYKLAKECKKAIEDSRDIVAKYIGAEFKEIIFTASSSESNNAAIQGYVRKHDCNIICSNIEHIDILECVDYLSNEVCYYGVDNKGNFNLEELEYYCSSIPNSLVIAQFVNNEIGVIEDIKKVCEIAHKYNCVVFCDATQAITKFDINVKDLGVDILSFGGHKIHALKCGVLYIKEGIELVPFVFGHQNKLVSGTENTPAIVSVGEVLKLKCNNEYIGNLRDYFEEEILKINGTYINGDLENRICSMSNVCFSGYDSETIQMMLDMEDIYCSRGSACNASSIETSHVLKAIGMESPDIYSCIRFSFDEENTKEEVDYTVEQIKNILEFMDSMD